MFAILYKCHITIELQQFDDVVNGGYIQLDEMAKFVDIEDVPDLKIRGVMLDISRAKVPSVETIKNTIKLLAELKYNHLELYIEGFSFETKKYPLVLRDNNYHRRK